MSYLDVVIVSLLVHCASVDQVLSWQASKFQILDKFIGDLNTKTLLNTVTGEYAEVVVDFGGRVEELYLQSRFGGGPPQKVLLSHNGNATAIKENGWWMGMLLVPWANRIAYGQYTFYGKEYQLPVNEDSEDPLRVNALHGFLAGKELVVADQDVDEFGAELTLSLVFDYEEGYPFTWSYEVTYYLSDISFSIDIVIKNTMASQPMLLYIGWHPYFACTAYNSIVTLDQRTGWNHVELDSNMDPTGITTAGSPFNGTTPIGGTPSNPTPYDDEYKATLPSSMHEIIQTKLYDPDTKKTVVLSQSPNMRFVHIFTGSTAGFGEGSVAMEPMSGMADGYNNHDDLSILSGGETWQASFSVHLE